MVVEGWDCAKDMAHMLEWYGRGDYRTYIPADVQREISAQTPGAVVVGLACQAPPTVETRAIPTEGTLAKVDGLTVAFPFQAEVAMVDGARWKLTFRLTYVGENMSQGFAQMKLRQDFLVLSAERAR